MLQNIEPKVYDNQFQNRTPQESDVLLIYKDGKALLRSNGNNLQPVRLCDFPDISPEQCRSLFRIDNQYYSMLRTDNTFSKPEGFSWYGVNEYRLLRPMEHLFPVAVGGSLARWYNDNHFCGRCGAENCDSAAERALVCPVCGKTIYPKICPAVIVAVRNGDYLLLTKYANRQNANYALVAGFAEIGESIEETVKREVLEETGVHVKNLTFYKSQPWVFTDTLLMGFFCDLDGADTITLQTDELAVGEWVERSNVPADHGKLSLTAEMMEQFRIGTY